MSNLFLRAYTAVVQAIAQNTGVNIVTGSSDGYSTDGKTILIPTIDKNSIGPLIHEVAHIKASDFSLKYGTPLEKHITNLLEDIRIEQWIGIQYPGARVFLADMVEHLVGTGFFSAPDDGEPTHLMQQFMLYRLRADVLGQASALEYSNAAEHLLRQKVPAGALVRLEALMYGVESATCAGECLQLAQAIIKMMAEEAKKEEEEKEKQKQQQSDPNQGQKEPQEAQSGEGPGDGQQDDQNSQQDPTQGSGEDQQPGTGNGAGKEEQSFLRQVLDAGDKDALPDVKDALVQACETAVKEGRVDTVGMPYTTKVFAQPANPASSKMLDDVSAATNALKVKTQALLQAETTATTRHVMQGTRIDPRKLHRAPTGGAIFKKVTQGKKLDTAIMVLVDRSVSMSGPRMELATKAALAASLAFNHQGVETSVMAFPYKDGNALLKSFDARAAAQVSKYESIGTGGSTPMAEAIMGACIALAQHRYQRKILLVTTDGDPDNLQATLEAISLARRSGMQVLGIGIQLDASRVFGKQFSTCVNNINDLPTAMVGVLRSAVFN